MEAGMVAQHAVSSLVQYMVLNASHLDTDMILEKLRTLALCWKEHRDQIRRTTDIINGIKNKTGKIGINQRTIINYR